MGGPDSACWLQEEAAFAKESPRRKEDEVTEETCHRVRTSAGPVLGLVWLLRRYCSVHGDERVARRHCRVPSPNRPLHSRLCVCFPPRGLSHHR